ncbi:MAG: EpsG family protein, partial [Firmicutes bacterium]|nr:EpsG family protein [Candidatus Caballimonas caccae]
MFFDNKKGFKYPYLIFFLFFILLFGLRHMTVAGDTISYVDIFLDKREIEEGFLGVFSEEFSEPLYKLLMYVLELITNNYTIYLIVFSLPFCIGISSLVKEESEDYFLTTLILCALGILYFCMAGLRQAVAMGLCLISFKFIKRRKLIPFLICILFAYGFHNSSLVFILAYPLYRAKTNSFYLFFVAICFFLGNIKSGIIKRIGLFLTQESRFDEYFLKEDAGLNYTAY